jgi:hypothetical protein
LRSERDLLGAGTATRSEPDLTQRLESYRPAPGHGRPEWTREGYIKRCRRSNGRLLTSALSTARRLRRVVRRSRNCDRSGPDVSRQSGAPPGHGGRTRTLLWPARDSQRSAAVASTRAAPPGSAPLDQLRCWVCGGVSVHFRARRVITHRAGLAAGLPAPYGVRRRHALSSLRDASAKVGPIDASSPRDIAQLNHTRRRSRLRRPNSTS